MFKKQIVKILQIQAKRYIKRHDIKLVAVAGSVGKTSTKLAIATVLSERFTVRVQEGNFNSDVSVPLVVFDLTLPSKLKNPLEWLKVLSRTEKMIRSNQETADVIVLELGIDHPGDMREFGKYLSPDIAVVTSVSQEHMEYFKTIDAVAKEELTIASFSKLLIINRDDVHEDFAKYADTASIDTYGLSGTAEYRFVIEETHGNHDYVGMFITPELGESRVSVHVIGEPALKSVVAAGAVAAKMGLTVEMIISGMKKIMPVPGRMQLLRGLEKSTIIDDTYNSSPTAVLAALQTLYGFETPQRIAILGSMNELGDFSPQAHEQIGKACDSALLNWVVTIGGEAEKYLAPAARANGCQVRSFKDPYHAGGFVHSVLQEGAVILAKGSQNGVFAEEAIKILLHDSRDQEKLVRQTDQWRAIKAKQFTPPSL